MSPSATHPARTVETWLRWLFPVRCFACGACGVGCWCLRCRADLTELPNPVCERCGSPCADEICGRCTVSPPPYDRARSAYVYQGSLRKLILAYKYRGYRNVAAELAPLLLPLFADARSAGAEIVTAVPSEPFQLWRRGYNPAGLLARAAAAGANLPFQPDLLRRRPGGRPQVGLNQAARVRNVRGRFLAARVESIADKKIILFDDIITTGSTCSEVARVLRAAGAQEILVVSLARDEHTLYGGASIAYPATGSPKHP